MFPLFMKRKAAPKESRVSGLTGECLTASAQRFRCHRLTRSAGLRATGQNSPTAREGHSKPAADHHLARDSQNRDAE